MTEKEIINNLKKAVYDIRIHTRESLSDYKKKVISLWYSVKNSLLNKENKESRNENEFYCWDDEEKIDELIKKDQMEIFEILAAKHLEKNKGFGETPKQFQTPCYICNQKTLTTFGWSEEGYPDNLERFYCRLCRTSFGWIDIKDDPLELQLEMKKYYLIFKEKEVEKDEKEQEEAIKKLNKIRERLIMNRQFIWKLKNNKENHV